MIRKWVLAMAVLLIAAQPAAGWQGSGKSALAAPADAQTAKNRTIGSAETNAGGGACPEPCEAYDVVVIGSEIEGVLLARAAHDHGKKVMILDPHAKPGGQLLQAQMFVLDEPRDKQRASLVQGRMKELYDGYNSKKIRQYAEFEAFYRDVLGPVPIESGIRITAIKTEQPEDMRRLVYLNYRGRDGRIRRVTADYWVENTDRAALTGMLNLTRIPGLETLFRDGGTEPEYMSATYMLPLENVDWVTFKRETMKDLPNIGKIRAKYGANTYVDGNFGTGFSNIMLDFKPSSDRLMLRGLNMTNQRDGKVIINGLLVFDVDPSDPASVRDAVLLGKSEAPRILEYLREHLPGFGEARLGKLPDYLYIREFDRYETLHVLTRDDLMSSRMFYDNVSIGGYGIDIQATRRIKNGIGLGRPDRYGLPLRSFLLKEIDNVIVAGKNAGAAANAYGSVRITPNTALAGEVIGILIGRETKHLRDLDADDFRRIHRYLEQTYHIRVRE